MLPRVMLDEARMVADPELRFTTTGKAVVSFTVVAQDRVKKGDEWTDGDALFVKCSAWDKLAENIAESLQRGDLVMVSGKMFQRKYQDREGAEKTSYQEMRVDQCGASLRWRTIPHGAGKAERASSTTTAPAVDPWATPAEGTPTDEPPF